VRAQVCVDVCIAGQGYADVATLRELPRHTGGELRLYAPFAAGLDADQLANDLRWSARRAQARPGYTNQGIPAGLRGCHQGASGARLHRRELMTSI